TVSPEAERIGAINTVVNENGRWVGHNTDGIGALKALQAHGGVQDRRVLIVGAGGTAKAIGHTLAANGARLTLTYNRNREGAQALADRLGARLIPVRSLDQEDMDILINCSPVGMHPDIRDTPCPAGALKPGMIVFDCVYNPLETRLIREARAAGCTAIPGVELFVNQAVAQFELWTGRAAPTDSMRQVVLNKLKEH
ncbi:MAG: shikimate dehydrogenase family protein, partial [Nitrospinaceae bacterium]